MRVKQFPPPQSCVLAALVLAFLSQGVAAEPTAPRVAMPLLKQAPTIDGQIDEAEWRHAVRSVGLVSRSTGAIAERQGTFWVGCDGKQLYLALKTEVAPDARILTRAVPDAERDVPAVLHDDAVELAIEPHRGRAAGARKVFHLLSNARGSLYDWTSVPTRSTAARSPSQSRFPPVMLSEAKHLNSSPAQEILRFAQDDRRFAQDDRSWRVGPRTGAEGSSWRLPSWQFRQKVADGWWHVEIAIPLSALGATRDELAGPWGVDLGRRWKRPDEQSLWGASGEAADVLPQVAWDSAAPVVRVMSFGDAKEPKIRLAVFNPHDRPIEAKVLISDTWHRDPPRELRESAVVRPGGEAEWSLRLSDGPQGLHNTQIRVASPDGSRVYYQRALRWSAHPSDQRWTVGEEQKQGLALQFKYYPYESRIRFRVSTEAMSLRERITGATAFLRRTDDRGVPAAEPLWRRPLELRNHVAEATCEIPSLGEGKYVFGVQLEGGQGVPRDPLVQPFVRQVFPWERNRLGISEEVMPPFTPLAAEGNTVRAVLREHRHGPSGLWEHVASDGQPLLAGPMTWEVAAAAAGQPAQPAAQTWPIESGGWRVTSEKATSVSGQSEWSAGPVKAHVSTEYDYDGMMLVTLTLEPTGGAAVHRLSLNIPLREPIARYMHAVSDGLRNNYAGFVPPGQGAVWDSGKAAKQEIVGTFYPYLWVGDGERGLCWFADTDRDWVLDDRTPTLELLRREGVLSMRVHFITRPGPLERKHRIVFGLQATPTKPMPEGWRRWTAHGQIQGGRPVRWLGACYYWGALSYDLYPYEYRFEFYDKLREARQSGQADRAFIDRWMAMVDRQIAPKGTERHEFLRRHVQAGFHSASSSPWAKGVRLFPYTNPRGVGFHVPEFATFQDEWLRYRYFNRNWGKDGDAGYDVSPSRSFQDYALWYYRKMLDCFDGVYWDNLFPSANFDPVVGGAWSDAQGRVHPTFGLMHLRELAKRTAVMLWQETKGFPAERRPPITLAHMTNTMIVPVLSFVNCTMDWEWKYGYEDFQDRFAPDLTVAETIGRQVGAWPTILAGGHPDHKDPRVDFLWRTRLGVCLVHEIQVFDWAPQRDGQVYAKLYEFGYGTAACRTFNYWQAGHPLRVEGVKACTLALARDGAAIVAVTDYSGGGTCRLTLDLAALGLKPEVQASDLETGQPIERAAPGVFSLPIKRHDLRILKVQP